VWPIIIKLDRALESGCVYTHQVRASAAILDKATPQVSHKLTVVQVVQARYFRSGWLIPG